MEKTLPNSISKYPKSNSALKNNGKNRDNYLMIVEKQPKTSNYTHKYVNLIDNSDYLPDRIIRIRIIKKYICNLVK